MGNFPWQFLFVICPTATAPGGCMSTLEGRLAALKADRCSKTLENVTREKKKKRSKEKQLKWNRLFWFANLLCSSCFVDYELYHNRKIFVSGLKTSMSHSGRGGYRPNVETVMQQAIPNELTRSVELLGTVAVLVASPVWRVKNWILLCTAFCRWVG